MSEEPKVKLTLDLARALFTQAEGEEMGVKVAFEGPMHRIEKTIYEVRKENPAWADIILVKPQGGTSFMLVKKTVELT